MSVRFFKTRLIPNAFFACICCFSCTLIVFQIAVQILVDRWESIGASVSPRMSIILGPVDLSYGLAIGKKMPAIDTSMPSLLYALGCLPGCSNLSLRDEGATLAPLLPDILRGFSPYSLDLESVALSEGTFSIIRDLKYLRRLTIVDCELNLKDLLRLSRDSNIEYIYIQDNCLKLQDVSLLESAFGDRIEVWQPESR